MSERVGCFRTIRARHVGELSGADKKTINILWNAAFLVLSSAALCGVCLWFAIGKYDLFYIFLGFRSRSHPPALEVWLSIFFCPFSSLTIYESFPTYSHFPAFLKLFYIFLIIFII